MELDRQAFQALLDEGKASFANGDPYDACPYDRNGDAEAQFGYRYWAMGWGRARAAAESVAAQQAASTGH
ncbi:hypothetical protein AB0H92_11080 [Streptomyces phaeochromogenes]|uniref:hypothetical protein n=1 Tax=Streptomyces TaxID=1883 RepID=UPI0033D32BBE